ncbi:MAG TPA: ribosome small subunit-dependent GTPase A, partial [Dermatophilaceae bacterium]|nr:ribosome small subunit-dependent GTPase A [Dermatophilaceae bacterium]
MSWDHLDESDVRVRPGRGSRPRTKDRPAHGDALVGTVVTVDRGRYGVLMAAGVGGRKVPERMVVAMKARELGRKGIVVGDDVGLVGDSSGHPDALARIVRVEPRRTVLRRSADDTDPIERVLVANADQLVVVSSLTDPPPRPRLIDRCL